jgi:hypothetical protein
MDAPKLFDFAGRKVAKKQVVLILNKGRLSTRRATENSTIDFKSVKSALKAA